MSKTKRQSENWHEKSLEQADSKNELMMTGFVYNSLGTLTEEEKSTLMQLVRKLYFINGIKLKITYEQSIFHKQT